MGYPFNFSSIKYLKYLFLVIILNKIEMYNYLLNNVITIALNYFIFSKEFEIEIHFYNNYHSVKFGIIKEF